MTIKSTSTAYQAGYQAFEQGHLLSDRPNELVMNWDEWSTGWHDAHATMTRAIKTKVP